MTGSEQIFVRRSSTSTYFIREHLSAKCPSENRDSATRRRVIISVPKKKATRDEWACVGVEVQCLRGHSTFLNSAMPGMRIDGRIVGLAGAQADLL